MPNDDVFDPNASGAETPAPKPARNRNKNTAPAPEQPTGDQEAEDLIGSGPTGPVIEDDVPLPSNNAGRKSAFSLADFPFDKLKVGQSFAVALNDEGKTESGITVKTILAQAKKALPDASFVSQVNDAKTSVRFWRKK
jgi:hypothetical protein